MLTSKSRDESDQSIGGVHKLGCLHVMLAFNQKDKIIIEVMVIIQYLRVTK